MLGSFRKPGRWFFFELVGDFFYTVSNALGDALGAQASQMTFELLLLLDHFPTPKVARILFRTDMIATY